MNTVDRLKKYYSDPSNSSVIGYIKGIKKDDEKIILEKDGKTEYVSMDELESGLFDFNTFSLKQASAPVTPVAEPQMSAPVQPEPAAPTQVMPTNEVQPQTIVEQAPVQEEKIETMSEEVEELHADNSLSSKITLNDIKTLAELNNKDTLDKALKEFASNPQTGEVDINKAISVIISNTVDEVAKAIVNNQVLPTELYKYDVTGKLIVPIDQIINGEAA